MSNFEVNLLCIQGIEQYVNGSRYVINFKSNQQTLIFKTPFKKTLAENKRYFNFKNNMSISHWKKIFSPV